MTTEGYFAIGVFVGIFFSVWMKILIHNSPNKYEEDDKILMTIIFPLVGVFAWIGAVPIAFMYSMGSLIYKLITKGKGY